MSLHDIYSMTLEEFGILYEEWNLHETARFRTSWEQTRFLACCSLTPYSKKGLQPTDLVCFEWEKVNKTPAAPVSKEDFERMLKKYGD